jgi:hypothetical protein
MDEGRVRKIIHIDMDAFYASVEQRDDPTLKGKPVAVGYPAKRGVVAAASYEARRFGVRSAMPSTIAMRKCSELVFVPPRFDVYREVSNQIRAIFRRRAKSPRAVVRTCGKIWPKLAGCRPMALDDRARIADVGSLMGQGRETLLGVDALGMPAFSARSFGA